MTAATVEKPTSDTGHPEPHVYPDNPQAGTPKVTRRPDPADELEPSEGFKMRIATMMQSVPQHDEEADVPADDVAERRRQVYAQAWANSLRDANVAELAGITLADLDGNQHGRILRGFIDQIGPGAAVLNLVLGGRVGSGKTTAAIAAGNQAADRGLMVRFIQHATYLRWLRPDGAPNNMPDWQIRRRFRDCDVLVLDDFAAGLDLGEPATKFVRDETTSLIGDRIDMGKATIITTNVQPEDLEVMIDERLVSRLSKRGRALRFTGEDRRGRLSW